MFWLHVQRLWMKYKCKQTKARPPWQNLPKSASKEIRCILLTCPLFPRYWSSISFFSTKHISYHIWKMMCCLHIIYVRQHIIFQIWDETIRILSIDTPHWNHTVVLCQMSSYCTSQRQCSVALPQLVISRVQCYSITKAGQRVCVGDIFKGFCGHGLLNICYVSHL